MRRAGTTRVSFDDDQRSRRQELREVADALVRERRFAGEKDQPGVLTLGRRTLRDELRGKAHTEGRPRASCGRAIASRPGQGQLRPRTAAAMGVGQGRRAGDTKGWSSSPAGSLLRRKRASSLRSNGLGTKADRATVGADQLSLAQVVRAGQDDASARMLLADQRASWMPFVPGNIRSTTAASNDSRVSRRSAASCVGRDFDIEAFDTKADGGDTRVIRFIFDDQ